MNDDYLNLDDVSERVLNIIKGFNLSPVAFGVVITLKKDEFEQLAENHPNHLHPGIILKTESKSDGTQWYVQILQEMVSEDNSNE
jgi:hypothetical protein